jgi:hypothetical protein
LQKLGYADEPDYDYLRNILFQVYSREGYPPDAPFDWNVKDKPRYLPPTKEMRPIMDGDPSTKPEDGKNSTKQPPKSGTKTNDSQDYYNIFQNGPNNPNDKPAKNVDSEHDNGKTKCRCCIM